ncbi:unnamed protein product [Ambrosiozyma monospora]|uniref:Unnamed protein product n=1 Tax=Ambrosiozyma monospora TaxID=43982 RepID=A0A9W6YV17_AMBMO|nr:unnamed protein product [Ambrosiozyma monospora]
MSSTSDLQQQDLSLYSDNTPISQKTLSPNYNSLNLLLNSQSNKPTWLITSLIESCLFDTNYINKFTNNPENSAYTIASPRSHVVFASFINGSRVYSKLFKKYLKLDIESHQFHSQAHVKGSLQTLKRGKQTNGFQFISFLEDGFENWFDTLINKLEQLRKGTKENRKKINLFLENPELVLYLQDQSPSHQQREATNELLSKLTQLNQLANVFIVSSSDKQLLDWSSELNNDLSLIHSDFLLKLVHKSDLIVQLKALTTGRADDVTGELKVSRGCLDLTSSIGVDASEKEYIYLANKEGAIKLFYR